MQSSRSYLALMAVSVVVIPIFSIGCGTSRQPWEEVFPARGVVSYKGKPLAGALITLVPQQADYPATVRPTATSQADGTFRLGTYSLADGAPQGEYKAVVLHFPVVGPKDNPSPGPNSLPGKYARAETTDLRITIAEGGSQSLPLNLK